MVIWWYSIFLVRVRNGSDDHAKSRILIVEICIGILSDGTILSGILGIVEI